MTVLVSGAAQVTRRLCVGFNALGMHVALLAEDMTGAAVPDGVALVEGATQTRQEAVATFASAAEMLGPLDGFVHVPGVQRLEDRLLAETDDDGWDAEAEAPIRQALVRLQGALVGFGDDGGCVVFVVPSIALTGAAGLAPFAAACEGVRLLGKSAARSCGSVGVRVNSISLPIEEWGHYPAEERVVPNTSGPALPGSNDASEIAGAVAILLSPLASAVTGATIGVDRGTVLAP